MIDGWKIFESQFGRKARASDAAWCRGLSTTERAQLVEDLYSTARQAHEQAADWALVEDLAWQQALAERQRFVAALRRLREPSRGRTPLADAR